jgi:glutamate racemase
LADVLAQRGALRHDQAAGSVTLLATDGPERFARVGAVFLGRPLAPADVEIVDLAFAPAPSGA